MAIPEMMTALVLAQDGYSSTSTGLAIDDLSVFLQLKTIPVPKPEGRQILVKIGRANVNPSDIHFIKGEYGQPRRKGVPAGFEAMGTVAAAGDAEGEKMIGRRVAISVTSSGSGAFADYALTDLSSAIPLIDAVSDTDGAALIVNPLTAYAMVHLVREYGSTAFVMTAGASQLCKLMASLARDEGMQAIATVRNAEHRASLEALGAAAILDTTDDGFAQALKQAVKEMKPLVLLDAVADQQSAAIFAALPAGAHWVVYGKLSKENPSLPDLAQLIFMKKIIEGFWLTEWMRKADPQTRRNAVETVQTRFASGAWKTDVAATLSLEEAPERLARALSGMNKGKVMLTP